MGKAYSDKGRLYFLKINKKILTKVLTKFSLVAIILLVVEFAHTTHKEV